MFAEMTPLEETRSYKEIFAKGAEEGRIRGINEGINEGRTEGRYETIREELERLALLKSQNVLTQELFEILSDPLKKEMGYLEVLREMKKT